MAYMAIVSMHLETDPRAYGSFLNLDWTTSIRGIGETSVVTGSPWTTVQTSQNMWWSDYSFTTETSPVGQTFPIEVRATPRIDCAGWTLAKWCVLRETAPGVYREEEVRPQGQTLVAPVTVLPNFQGHIEIFPYFIFVGTGNLLATTTGNALAGVELEANIPSLLIDL